MCITPILTTPYFTKTFLLGCDDLEEGLGVVSLEEGHLVAFISKKLCDHNLEKSTYEKEMIDILHGVEIGTYKSLINSIS